VLERQSAHMTRLIDGLLEVSRIARGKIALARQALDLRDVLDGVLADRRRLIRDSGLKLHLEQGDEPLWVWADPVRLAQVFDNLIGNAIKFTAGPGTITLTLAAEQGQAVIRVSDTGAGIRPELIPHIFEPFRQEAQGIARSAGGLGLGLALVRGLVELHEGTVGVHSKGPGTGATLTVRLPLSTARSPEQAGEGPLAGASLRLLIVEDNEDAALMLRELLQLRGHTVTVVDTGAEALALLRRQSIDVVLCDIGLPDMSGYDVARVIRQDPALAGLGLVAITGYGQAEDRERTRAVGFDEHLTKPVDLRTLERVLAQLPRGPR
jgi:two-component system, chemotaxis family, CheB/CheR fusion protein